MVDIEVNKLKKEAEQLLMPRWSKKDIAKGIKKADIDRCLKDGSIGKKS